ncbi:MAG TPA: alpha-E domain-containing protein [Alphaproteobacteria bacterium]|nr:alpha-E domain-containing protein [Alphaproteobacteria bacterium]
MLSRAADNLYWMARYMERAENMARMLDVAYRMALLPGDAVQQRTQWESAIIIAGCEVDYTAKNGVYNADSVIAYLATDLENRSSIRSSLQAARENARAMRAQITNEMWESLNDTWLEVRNLDYPAVKGRGSREFFDWVKERSHLFRGVSYGTMQRDEAYHFVRLGGFLERADSTARILDVKYHVLLPSPADVGGAVDYYQWAAILRSVSAFRAYRKIYRDVIVPRRVAELLILRPDMPRSLVACLSETERLLVELRALYGHDYESTRLAASMCSRLRYGSMDQVFDQGLHEYLTETIDRNIELGKSIARDFMALD